MGTILTLDSADDRRPAAFAPSSCIDICYSALRLIEMTGEHKENFADDDFDFRMIRKKANVTHFFKALFQR